MHWPRAVVVPPPVAEPQYWDCVFWKSGLSDQMSMALASRRQLSVRRPARYCSTNWR